MTVTEANALIRKSKKGTLPIVTKTGRLVALVARADLKKHADFPLATKDSRGSLMVAASVGTRPGVIMGVLDRPIKMERHQVATKSTRT